MLYQTLKQKVQIDALMSEFSNGSDDEDGVEIIRSYKDEGVRDAAKRKKRTRDISGDYLEKGFGGVSYQDEVMSYGRHTKKLKSSKVGLNKNNTESGRLSNIVNISDGKKVKCRNRTPTTHNRGGTNNARKRNEFRSKRLKLDKTLACQEPIIRQSLQSEGYYRRHRQKARNGVSSIPSSTSVSKTPKSGSVARQAKNSKKKKKNRIPIFQHIPLSFMNSATPKMKKREHKRGGEISAGMNNPKFSDTMKHDVYKVHKLHQRKSNERNIHSKSKDSAEKKSLSINNRGGKRSRKRGSKTRQKSSLLDLDGILAYGTLKSSIHQTEDYRDQASDYSNRNTKVGDILKTYGQAGQYHNTGFGKGKYEIHVTNNNENQAGSNNNTNNSNNNTSNLRDRRTKLSARKQRKQYSMNSLSNLMTMPHTKNHERGTRHSHKTSKGATHGRTLNMTSEESSQKMVAGGPSKHSDHYLHGTSGGGGTHQHHSKRKMKRQRNLSTKNLQNLRSSQTGHGKAVPKGLSTYEEEFLQLSPSLQKNTKISSSYNGCYNLKHDKHHHSKHAGSSKLNALKEAEEFVDFSSSTYNKIKNELRQSKNIAKMQRKQKRMSHHRSKKSTDIDIQIDISGKALKTYGNHGGAGTLTLDIENLENHKLTNTHYQHSHLPPQSPLNQFQYPSTTKNSKNDTTGANNRRVRRVPTDEGNPLSLLSMNGNPKTKKLAKKIQYAQAQKQEQRRSMKDSYDRGYEGATSSKYKKRHTRGIEYFNYEHVTQSYVDGKDGTRNYQIKEITDFEDNSNSSREVRMMRSSNHHNNGRNGAAAGKHRKHKQTGSYGGYGDMGHSYREKESLTRESVHGRAGRDRSYHHKYRKMKSKMAMEGTYRNSQSIGGAGGGSGKENLLNFAGAQWK